MSKKLDELFNVVTDEIIDYDDMVSVDDEIVTYDSITKLPRVIVEHESYDQKDNEIEHQFDEIYDKAINAFDTQVEATEDIEGRYMARNNEVAAQFLSTALNAAKEKANLKSHSDNLKLKKEVITKEHNITNNNLIIDRNQLLDMLNNEDK